MKQAGLYFFARFLGMFCCMMASEKAIRRKKPRELEKEKPVK